MDRCPYSLADSIHEAAIIVGHIEKTGSEIKQSATSDCWHIGNTISFTETHIKR